MLHGYSGSIAPDLVEYAPFLRRTAGVLGLDFRGHGGSDDGPSTFGLLETEDIAGALAWFGERGITRVALFGTSMGGIAAIAAVAVLGDGTLAAADGDPTAPRDVDVAPRPTVVGVVADSTAPELEIPVATRMRGPAGRFMAARLFDGATRVLRRRSAGDRAGAGDRPPRDRSAPAHPRRSRHDGADRGRSTAGRARGPVVRALGRPGRRAQRAATPSRRDDYERRVTDFLRLAFRRGRGDDVGAAGSSPIIAAPGSPAGDPRARAPAVED